jgi:hypothetical protein
VLELRREQYNEDPEQHSSHVRRLVRRLQRHDPIGDHAPLGVCDAGGCLQQVDRLGAQARPLDFQKVIEPVERGGETVGERPGEVAIPAAVLTMVAVSAA